MHNKRQLLDITLRNAKRLLQLTEGVLDVSRIESNLLQLKREQFNLTDMMINCILDFRNQIKNENRDCNLKLETLFSIHEGINKKRNYNGNILIEADRNRLYQKRRKEKENNHKEITISISDTGPGIDPEIFPRLFSKFAIKSETGGTGLGLYISKSIIEAHGGKMWAHNNNNDGKKRGATIYFTLPLMTNNNKI